MRNSKNQSLNFKLLKVFTGKNLKTEEILSSHLEQIEDLWWLNLALLANKFEIKKIENSLPLKLKLRFHKDYNRAFLWSKIWGMKAKILAKQELNLPNLYLPQEAEKRPDIYYQIFFGREWLKKKERCLVRKWEELLELLAQRKI